MNPGDTGAERAAYVQNSEWIHLVFVGRVLKEASYSIGGEALDGGVDSHAFPREYQNVTFSLDETLFNSDGNGALPSNVIVGDDGSMTVETHTETTCCLCGLSVSGIGTQWLVELEKSRPLGLSSCGITCPIATDGASVPNTWGGICADTVSALGGAVGNIPPGNGTMALATSPTPAGAQDAVEVDTVISVAPTPSTPDATSNTVLSTAAPTEDATPAPASG